MGSSVVYKKRGRKNILYGIEYSNNQYIIDDGNYNISVVFDKKLATLYHSIEDAEEAMRRLWIDGKIIKVKTEA